MERLNGERTEHGAQASILRAIAIVAGLLLVVLGAFMAFGPQHPTQGAPSVMEFVFRPVTPAGTAGGPASWRLLVDGEQQAPDDVMLSIGFGVQRSGGRKSQNFPELKADLLAEPGQVSLPNDRKHVFALAHIDLIANEAERQTGQSAYATAVRNLGEWVSADGGKTMWGWPLLVVGLTVIGAGMNPKRFGWGHRNGRASGAGRLETGRSGVA